jgi:DNA ligase D-like protein (predicted ligase)
MLATSGPMPTGSGWAFEFSWDGIRSLAQVELDRVRLLSSNERSIGASYPELDVLAERAGGRQLLLDGKIVALDIYGKPSLGRLQRRMNLNRPPDGLLRRVPVAYYVFDLLRLDDVSILELPFAERRALLEELDLAGGVIVVPPCFQDTDGAAVLETASQYGLPGVIAKRADSGYHPGRRSRSWIETPVRREQEVIVGGWTAGKRGALGALLVGVPTECGLRYVGSVGTGISEAHRVELAERLSGLAQQECPFFGEAPQPERTPNWVAPALLGEVTYRGWTPHGRLAYPAWQGVRPSKHPAAVRGPIVLPKPVPARPVDDASRADLEESVRKAQAEVRLLRSQLSAHFLYNALNTMRAMIRTDPDRARALLAEFARFTRYSLDSRRRESGTLGEELANIERYLTIEHARLGPRLRYELRFDPDSHKRRLPYLALQLLVMNAVRHGVEEKPGGGTVTVSAAADGDDLVITVQDDGPGMPPHLASARAEAEANLRAVRDRVAESDLEVVAEPMEGTTSKLRLRGRRR